MITAKSRFDGHKIEVPSELQGKEPADVVVIYDDSKKGINGASGPGSIWDHFGKAGVKRTADDIDRQLREERGAWDQ